ncbi:MAG: sulfatase-like hydrolase/transferase [Pseudomonadota bacterium]
MSVIEYLSASQTTKDQDTVGETPSSIISRKSLGFSFWAVVVPNIFFLIISPFYLAGRLISPFLFLMAALVALFAPRAVAIAAFLLAATVDLSLIIMLAFSLPLDVALDSLRHFAEINPASSALYVAVVFIVASTACFAAIAISKNRMKFRKASLLPALLLAASASAADYVFTWPYVKKPDVAFDSARLQTGMTSSAIAESQRNLLIVMVEGLGAFGDEAERDIFQKLLTAGKAQERFTVERGSSYYNGSTTGAAARELCGRWGDYIDYIQSTGPFDCLPNQLRAAGFETTAVHAFGTDMFQRDVWYPRIGFENLQFMDTLSEEQPERFEARCGSVFEGLCDEDVSEAVHDRLTGASEKPQFVYWLTLNSHIPFLNHQTDTMQCRTETPKMQNKTVCELANIWASVFERVNKIASDPSLPPTDILVVGDHHTPLWERAAKNRFVLDKVDWYLMRYTD